LMLARGSPTSGYLMRGWQAACAELGISDATVVRETATLDSPGHRRIVREVLTRCRRSGITALIGHTRRP
jgi:hypothetical protein